MTTTPMTTGSRQRVRPPAVAGAFYPARPRTLRAAVEDLLADAEVPAAAPPKAIIAPHAGYVYSGPVAASAFRALEPIAEQIRRVVLLGPSHRVPLRGLALPGADALATPLGELPVDRDLAARVAALPAVSENPEAHRLEHSLEVELPFLQVLLDGITVLPLVVGEADGEAVAGVLEAVWGGGETVVVVSSDLSHYLPHDEARRVDRETADAICRLDGPIAPARACGARAIDGLLLAARRHDLSCRLLDLRTSGDTAGDRERVVGYGAFTFAAVDGRD